MDFRGRLDTSLERVRLLLDREKSVGLRQADDNCQHSYEDKFILVEQAASCALLAIINNLQFLGLTNEQMQRAKGWSEDAVVSLRLDISSRCKYLREETRKESIDVSTDAEFSLGSLTAKATSKVVTKITEYFYELECTWRLCIVRGTGLSEESDVMEICSRTATQECAQRTKEFPFPESSSRSESCEIGWVLDWLQQERDSWIVSVRIDRGRKDCYTPSRNTEMKIFMESFVHLSAWANAVHNYFGQELFGIHVRYNNQGHNKLDLSLATHRHIFMPLQPLFRDLSLIPLSSKKKIVMTPKDGLHYKEPERRDGASGTTLGDWEVNVFLEEQRRSLSAQSIALQEHFPSATVVTNCLFSLREAIAKIAVGHITMIGEQFWGVVELVESMLRSQLIRAIGKEVTPTDFSQYMRYHYRRLFRPAYRPQVWSVSVRRTKTHSPEGSIRIESRVSSDLSQDGFQPLECFCASGSIPRSSNAEGYTSIALSAATKILVGGERHVHGWLGHRFSNSDPVAADLRLSISSRQFSGFIVVLGRMTGGRTFDAKHGFLVQNTEELMIPLLLETIPNAQQFREAISSLSPEQQRFAQAYRSMQLESTLFGICVIQLKPQLEKVLNLPPDSLTKEIQLTQDLLKLFVQYQISADLLSYDPLSVPSGNDGLTFVSNSSGVSAQEKIDVVKENVQKILLLVEGMKKEEVRKRHPEGVRIFVKTLTGNTVDISVDPFGLVEELMEKIYEKQGVPADQQRLVFAGKQLERHRAISDYNLTQDSTIHMVLRLRGGPEKESAPARVARAKAKVSDSVDTLLMRSEALDSIEEQAETLQLQSAVFSKKAMRKSSTGGLLGGIMGMLGSKTNAASTSKVSSLKRQPESFANTDMDFSNDRLSGLALNDDFDDSAQMCDVVECSAEPAPESAAGDEANAEEGGDAEEEAVVSREQSKVSKEMGDMQVGDQEQVSRVMMDVTAVPRLLDDAFDRLDVDHAVRPTIINIGESWRHRKARPLSQRSAGQSGSLSTISRAGEEESVDSAAQVTMRQKAFDLLDALTRSGGLPCEDAALHIVVAATHTFDESVLETVVQRNLNPIEAVERSSVIMASVLHDIPGHCLIENSEISRLQAVSLDAAKAVLGM